MSDRSSRMLSSSQRPPSRLRRKNLAAPRRRSVLSARTLGIGAVLLVLAVTTVAWFDGGEEPLRPIVTNVALPTDTAATGDGA
ncbi:MAG: hypothetical protein WA985_07370 [Erythrobacter sp.]